MINNNICMRYIRNHYMLHHVIVLHYNGESNAIYKTLISQTVKEICTIIQGDVFCVHKPGFLMLGHI